MKTVFFDIDTQIDFMFPAGALYVPGAEKIIENVAALNRSAALVISTMDAHAEDDVEFRQWPHHCVAGTLSQRKPASTLLENRVIVPSCRSEIPLGGAGQVILEKQTFDCFSNANLHAILDRLNAGRFIVYGVVTEICVNLAAFGLLKTGKRVELVTDAVRSLSEPAAAKMFSDFTASGGALTTVAQALACDR